MKTFKLQKNSPNYFRAKTKIIHLPLTNICDYFKLFIATNEECIFSPLRKKLSAGKNSKMAPGLLIRSFHTDFEPKRLSGKFADGRF